MSAAGYTTNLKASGLATVMTSEAMSTDGSTVADRYQIDDATKEVWERSTTATFSFMTSTGTLGSSEIVKIDYLFGKVTATTTVAGDPRVTGEYLPMVSIAGAHTYTLTQVSDVLDATDFDSTGQRSKVIGLLDVNLSVAQWYSVSTSTAADLYDKHHNAIPLVVEIAPGGTTSSKGRGWFLIDQHNQSGDVASLEQTDLNFVVDGTTRGYFNWQDL